MGVIRSIQGEQEQKTHDVYAMSDGDVERYVAEASDGVLACREDRHQFGSMRSTASGGLRFTEEDSDGNFVRELLCTQCELAVRRERWGFIGVGKHRQFHRIDRQIRYLTGPKGEKYLVDTGHGKPSKRQIGDVLMTQELRKYTLTDIRKSLAPRKQRVLKSVESA